MSLYLTLWGCGGIHVRPISPLCKRKTSCKAGESYTANTGSPILVASYNICSYPTFKPRMYYQPPGIEMPSATFNVQFTATLPPITPDQKWAARYVHGGNYIVICSQNYSPTLGIEITPNGELADEEAWVSIENYDPNIEEPGRDYSKIPDWMKSQRLFTQWMWSIGAKILDISSSSAVREKGKWQPPTLQLFEEVDGDIIEYHEGSFKAELIYTGKMDNIIRISYREYIDNMARPAFSQELRYDLSEGNEISFQSLRMKVLEATNTKITIQVIDGELPSI
ncbi:MAG: hypothetical protein AB1847_03180 [bacterium]